MSYANMAHGRIILVDENHDTLAIVGGGKGIYGSTEIDCGSCRPVVRITRTLQPFTNVFCEFRLEILNTCRRDVIELEMDHRVLLPRPVRTIDVKPTKQLSPSGKESLQRRKRERLSEPPRTRDEEEVRSNIAHHAMHKHRLVDVNTTLLTQLREVRRVCRSRSHGEYFTKIPP